jgi:hypothetical protein
MTCNNGGGVVLGAEEAGTSSPHLFSLFNLLPIRCSFRLNI